MYGALHASGELGWVPEEAFNMSQMRPTAPRNVTIELVSLPDRIRGAIDMDVFFCARHLKAPDGERKGGPPGVDPRTRDRVMRCGGAKELLGDVCATTQDLAKKQDRVTVGVGCKSGKHRSVTIVEEARG